MRNDHKGTCPPNTDTKGWKMTKNRRTLATDDMTVSFSHFMSLLVWGILYRRCLGAFYLPVSRRPPRFTVEILLFYSPVNTELPFGFLCLSTCILRRTNQMVETESVLVIRRHQCGRYTVLPVAVSPINGKQKWLRPAEKVLLLTDERPQSRRSEEQKMKKKKKKKAWRPARSQDCTLFQHSHPHSLHAGGGQCPCTLWGLRRWLGFTIGQKDKIVKTFKGWYDCFEGRRQKRLSFCKKQVHMLRTSSSWRNYEKHKGESGDVVTEQESLRSEEDGWIRQNRTETDVWFQCEMSSFLSTTVSLHQPNYSPL